MMKRTVFGTMPDGRAVEEIVLRDGALTCSVITYGGILRALTVPDKDGNPVDVLLGMDALKGYLDPANGCLGALVGRCANRIGGASFPLNGREYRLAANAGPNHLHGGPTGFYTRLWTAEEVTDNSVLLTLFSPDGDEGYPGNLRVRVRYTLADGALRIDYAAKCDADTIVNLTNHAYFNLSGHDSGPMTDQTIQIFAGRYTPTDAASIPTGEIASVEGTPMDLRQPVPIGAHIDDGFQQLTFAGGYDHNWVLDGGEDALHPAARAYSPRTGIALEVLTTLPGVQFYAANSLDGCPAGKGGAPYGRRWGFCLETQLFPDSPHHPNFPSAVLRAGEVWEHATVLRFSRR